MPGDAEQFYKSTPARPLFSAKDTPKKVHISLFVRYDRIFGP